MNPQADQHPSKAAPGRSARQPSRLRAAIVAMLALGFLGMAAGFVAFLSQLRIAELKPDRNADGIVVLTGGSSRVSDAIELLAGGFGKRLLISGVHRANGVSDISRSLPDSQGWLTCCVDLDRSAVNTRSNAAETRRWAHERGFKSLIVVTSNYHMPRAIVEMSHAMPEIELIPFAVVGDKWREDPWWTSGGTFRLLLSEYAKYIAAELRVRLAHLGIELSPDAVEPGPEALNHRKPATALAN
ncbi:MAG: YdcF family protein [Rhodopseudomonas sp.]|uniref:YdcF family protein n=1 Tax=Rhodopseudomonas sp. TaxID=1078 RepID=UPI0018025103|nr:YdcF family protein [Rhodopseudomonas sp.]NVN88137.1 YdcF family protein [Rhodopseudomonas sp.]